MQGRDQDLETLIRLMAKLPGLGPRSAPRAVLHLVKRRSQLLDPLAAAMERVAERVRHCEVCGNIGTATPCDICCNPDRENGQVCVVEDVPDLWAIERTAVFKGRYHVLGGVLSILDGAGPEQLRIPNLLERVAEANVTEVILALGSTVEGQTTAHYIADELENAGIRVTSLARGVPMGGELNFLDDGTISTAIHARKVL